MNTKLVFLIFPNFVSSPTSTSVFWQVLLIPSFLGGFSANFYRKFQNVPNFALNFKRPKFVSLYNTPLHGLPYMVVPVPDGMKSGELQNTPGCNRSLTHPTTSQVRTCRADSGQPITVSERV